MKSQQSVADVLTPDALRMLGSIEEQGSMAAAARALGLVPSALSYRVRQLEQALDVLLFDRSSRQARLTEAGLAPRKLVDFAPGGTVIARFFFIADPDGYQIEVLQRGGRYL